MALFPGRTAVVRLASNRDTQRGSKFSGRRWLGSHDVVSETPLPTSAGSCHDTAKETPREVGPQGRAFKGEKLSKYFSTRPSTDPAANHRKRITTAKTHHTAKAHHDSKNILQQ
jgi:hypothetical protein